MNNLTFPVRFTAFLIAIVVDALLGLAGVPWWVLPVLALFTGLVFALPPKATFAGAFAGGFFVWGGVAVMQYMTNDGVWAANIGAVFLGASGWHLLVVTGLLGGLLAGLGALTGTYAVGGGRTKKAESTPDF